MHICYQTSSPALPHQPSRPPRHDQYEICGLTRIFHTKSITACGKLIITALFSNCDLSSMCTYSPASQSFARLILISFAQRLM
ncbi:MAG: hypothetical protein K9M81_01280, partial [Chthoniobacterales bacterium]|nr:hypothetical protein [Chthoniobacterales bacterium]